MTRTTRALTMVLALGVGATACSGSHSAAKGALAGRATSTGGAMGPARAADSSPAVERAPRAAAASAGRSVVSTGQLQVRVDDIEAASARASTIVNGVNGVLFTQSTDLARGRDATLVFKVPPERFELVLGELGDLGRLLTRQVATDDVTDQVVDLEGRLETATASADRLRALFANASDVSAIVAVEGELAKREAEVESLQGQLRTIDNQVRLATVTLTLTHRAQPAREAGLPGFTGGLAAGWSAFVDVLAASATALGAALPFVVVAGLTLAGIWVGRRRRALDTTARGERV